MIKPLFPVNPEGLEKIAESLLNSETKQQDKFSSGYITIDEQPADNGNVKTPNQWIDYYDKISDGRYASAVDYLQIAKQLKNADQEKVKTLLESLRSDFSSWLTLNTRINYDSTGLNAKVIQNYKCRDKSLIRETSCKVPILGGVYLNNAINDKEVQQYLKTITGIDDINETASLLQYISNKPIEKIKLWTPDQGSRVKYPERAVRFVYYDTGFHVVGDDRVDSINGHSRLVRQKKFP